MLKYRRFRPFISNLSKHAVKVALKNLPHIGEVLFGIGNDLINSLIDLIEDSDDAFLF